MDENKQEQIYHVSVVIPAYNSGAVIGRAVESVLAQTRPADEIIVVDDGSTDDTGQEVKRYGDKVCYIRQENAGASVARNTGVEAALYEWIAFLDADDEWLTDKLKLQVEHLERNPELLWTTANFDRCLCDEDRQGPDMEQGEAERLLAGKEYFNDFFQAFTCRCCGWTGTMLIKKEVIEQAGMFRPGQLMANDIDLWFRIAYRYPRIGYIAQPLAVYHMTTPHSISKTYRQLEIRRELLERHLKLAAEFGREKAFEPCVKHMVSTWIRELLFENQPEKIRQLMSQFEKVLTFRFKTIIRLLLVSPGATAGICHAISKVVRTFGFRRQIVRRPTRAKKQVDSI